MHTKRQALETKHDHNNKKLSRFLKNVSCLYTPDWYKMDLLVCTLEIQLQYLSFMFIDFCVLKIHSSVTAEEQ